MKKLIDTTAKIHPSSVIEEGATIGANVEIGPFCMVGADVVLANDVKLISHVSIMGRTTVGERTIIYPYSSIGHRPQDLKFNNEPSTVEIGADNHIREYVTIQPGTEGGLMKTVVGNNCLLMANVHIAHDCVVGDHVVMANCATLAGHVHVESHVVIGGLSAVQQFVRIGSHSMIGGMSGVDKDVIPYALVMGQRAHLHGLNLIGLRRHGFSNAEIQQLKEIYQKIFEENSNEPFNVRVKEQYQKNQDENNSKISSFFSFIESDSKRHFCMPSAKSL